MTVATELTLPGTPGPTLQAVWGELGAAQEAFLKHLLGETSAEWLSEALSRHGLTLSASSIRTYRRLTRGGV